MTHLILISPVALDVQNIPEQIQKKKYLKNYEIKEKIIADRRIFPIRSFCLFLFIFS